MVTQKEPVNGYPDVPLGEEDRSLELGSRFEQAVGDRFQQTRSNEAPVKENTAIESAN